MTSLINDYSEEWPEQFERTAAELRGSLGEPAVRIDHIGSTAAADPPARAAGRKFLRADDGGA